MIMSQGIYFQLQIIRIIKMDLKTYLGIIVLIAVLVISYFKIQL